MGAICTASSSKANLVGVVEVFYTKQMPHADEGPFLKEERKLIETVAERIASTIIQRRLKAAYKDWIETTGAIGNGKTRVASRS